MTRGSPTFFFLLLILIFSLSAPFAFGQKIGPEEDGAPHKPPLYSQTLLIDGIKIHFVEAGEGRPLLFLHGLGGSWEDWSASLQSFASSHRAMAIDFPGFGDSDKPDVDYSIEWLTGIVEKFLEERKLLRVSIVGHSMGALVALKLAARGSSRVQRLIVVDAVGIGDKAEFLSYVLTKKIMGPDSRWESIEGVMKDQFKGMIEIFIKVQKPKTSKEFFQSVPEIARHREPSPAHDPRGPVVRQYHRFRHPPPACFHPPAHLDPLGRERPHCSAAGCRVPQKQASPRHPDDPGRLRAFSHAGAAGALRSGGREVPSGGGVRLFQVIEERLQSLPQVLGNDVQHPAVEGQKDLGFFPRGHKLPVALAQDLEAKGQRGFGGL